jgi:hypothetical protein
MNDPPLPERPEQEAFVAQVLSYLDGGASPQDLSELKEVLASRPAFRLLFVQVCRLHGVLTGLLGRQPVKLPAIAARAEGAASPMGDVESGTAPSIAPEVQPGPASEPDDTGKYIEDSGNDTAH